MLREQPVLNVLLVNIMLGTVWHYLTFFLCRFLSPKIFFDPKRRMFKEHKWEKGGRIYNDALKINKWKDMLPQHIDKDGFSKSHLDDLSVRYLDEFIMETCRAEWNHTMNCFFAFVLFALNDPAMAALLTILLIVGNLPFAVIQRYNRFRLQRLKRTVVRKQERKKNLSQKTAVSADDNDNETETVA